MSSSWGSIRACRIAFALGTLMFAPLATAIVIETVPVGNPGNAADGNGAGAVSYAYSIGKFEVTSAQYTTFLSSVAASDPYGLYDPRMYSDPYGCKIQRGGSAGSYTYSVAADWANRPVGNIDLWDAARFCNWLNNGQPTGAEDTSTTEDGSYYLNGALAPSPSQSVSRTSAARFVIPSLDEWYKAAFHKNDGVTGSYWAYATNSNTLPSNSLINPDPGNHANYNLQAGSVYTIGSPYYRTVVGEFENSASPYGTFDQAGNAWEWNEAMPSLAGLRGGSFYGHENWLLSTAVYGDSPPGGYQDFGFRVAEIPEPASLLLIAFGGVMAIRRRRRFGSEHTAARRELVTFSLVQKLGTVGCGVAVLWLTASVSNAEILLSPQPFNSDADCGIGAGNVYTHAIDAGNDVSSSVNGVTFTGYMPGMSLANFSYGEGRVASDSVGVPLPIALDQQVYQPMYRFIYASAGVGRLSGLTPGMTYEARVYLRSYSLLDRLVNIVFDEDGAGPLGQSTGTFDEDDARTVGFQERGQPYWVGYRYTATSSSFEWTPQNLTGNTFHFYAFTNQVIPEPTSIVSSFACMIMLRRPRRRY